MRPSAIATVILLFSGVSFGNSFSSTELMSQMAICQLASASNCNFLPLARVPTVSTAQLISLPKQWALGFSDLSGATFTVPLGQTWTQDVTLSWLGHSLTRPIFFPGCSGCKYGIGFEMDISKEFHFFKPTLFTLNTSLFNSRGQLIASATDKHFFLVEPVPEPSGLLLLGTGFLGLLGVLCRRPT